MEEFNKNLEFGLNHLTSLYMTCELIDRHHSRFTLSTCLTLNRLRVQLHITALREELQYFLLQFLALLRKGKQQTAVGILEMCSDCHIDKDQLYKKKRKTKKTTKCVFCYFGQTCTRMGQYELFDSFCEFSTWMLTDVGVCSGRYFLSDFHRSFPELRTSANMTRWDVNPLECLKSLL